MARIKNRIRDYQQTTHTIKAKAEQDKLDNRANKGSTLGSHQNSGTIGSDVNFKGRKNDDLKQVGLEKSGNDKES